VSNFSGGTFTEAYSRVLEFLVPGYDKKKADQCYRELSEKRTAIYKTAEVFPEVVGVLKQLSENPHLRLIISSGSEKNYIEEWLAKVGIKDLFEEIYSVAGDGTKEKHIQMIRQKHPGEKIIFIGDSILEMQLGVPAIGVAREDWQRDFLMMAGARVVIRSLDELIDLDLNSL
jgi:phosphoglycolate phosphatase-like HAD superfamily hydrolase